MTLKFVDYNDMCGGLCHGTLIFTDTDTDTIYEINNCLCSGGTCSVNGDGDEEVTQGAWTVNSWALPDELRSYIEDIEAIVNDNVPYGCCGSCI